MVTDKSRHVWNYSFKNEEIEGVKTGASEFIDNQKGTYSTSSVSHNLSYVGVDDRFNPTKGTRWSFSNQLAGLGGNISFLKTDIKHSMYYSPIEDLSLIHI